MAIITHYTSLRVLLNHILESEFLRLSSLSGVNDPYEYTKRSVSVGGRGDFDPRFLDAMRLAEEIVPDKIKVGCFVADEGQDENYNNWTSILKAPLWAHYGDNNQGVALVFDLDTFLSACRAQIDHPWALHGKRMNYTPALRSLDDPYSVELDEIGEVNHLSVAKHLFEKGINVWFNKDEQWAYENEYRVILFNEQIGSTFVSIKDCMKAVVFGERVSRIVLNTVGHYCHGRGIIALALHYDDIDNHYTVNNYFPNEPA